MILTLLAMNSFGQDRQNSIGNIEFFGYSGISLDKLRSSLPLHEGDAFDLEKGEEQRDQFVDAIKTAIGYPPTDVSLVCCDSRGKWIIYVGISGKTLWGKTKTDRNIRLPSGIIDLYERLMNTLMDAVLKGISAEDRSKGYAISEYPPARSLQMEVREYAVANDSLLRDVLRNSSEDHQRIVAAHIIGYAQQSESQIETLAAACIDGNSTVRNNAIRSLMVLVESNPKIAKQIPADELIELLLSGTWSDLNKSSHLLSIMTRDRDKSLLTKLNRREAVERLFEIAKWKTGHSESAKYILGRMARIDEAYLRQLVEAGRVDEIIDRLNAN